MARNTWLLTITLVMIGATVRAPLAAATQAPHHLQTRQLTATSVVLAWKYSKPVDYYTIQLERNNRSHKQMFRNVVQRRKKIGSKYLRSNQAYQFFVQACVIEPSECTKYSQRKRFRTNPAKITSTTVNATNANGISFQINSKPPRKISQYQARVMRGETLVFKKKFTSQTENPSPQYSLTGLEAETDYSMQVRARFDSDHNSVWSDAVTFTTAEDLSVTGVSPATGYTDLESTVEITGTGFQDDATAYIGDTAATSTTVNSSTGISAQFDDGLSAATYTVTVTNPDLTSAGLEDGFTVNEPPAEWTKQSLTFTGSPTPLTSTSTIVLPDNITYRMYFTGSGGIWTTTSTDGISWQTPVATDINDTGCTNPNVLQLTDGTFLMIYGVQTNEPTTEQLFRATSTNGILFTKQTGLETDGAVLVADDDENNFVSVPDLIDLGDGRIRMYFVASTPDSTINSAISTDNGATWEREGGISITGGGIGGQENDPDIIQLSDGSYRLFFTTPPTDQAIGDLRIRSAVSTDGRNFTLESGSRVTPSGSAEVLMDPDTILEKGTTDSYMSYYGANLLGGGPDDLRVIVSD